MHLNVRSLRKKQLVLGNLIDLNHCDIICVSVTWLKPFQDLIAFPDFQIFRKDITGKHQRGVAILVKKNNQSQINRK